jgi:hypothetical protein
MTTRDIQPAARKTTARDRLRHTGIDSPRVVVIHTTMTVDLDQNIDRTLVKNMAPPLLVCGAGEVQGRMEEVKVQKV